MQSGDVEMEKKATLGYTSNNCVKILNVFCPFQFVLMHWRTTWAMENNWACFNNCICTSDFFFSAWHAPLLSLQISLNVFIVSHHKHPNLCREFWVVCYIMFFLHFSFQLFGFSGSTGAFSNFILFCKTFKLCQRMINKLIDLFL